MERSSRPPPMTATLSGTSSGTSGLSSPSDQGDALDGHLRELYGEDNDWQPPMRGLNSLVDSPKRVRKSKVKLTKSEQPSEERVSQYVEHLNKVPFLKTLLAAEKRAIAQSMTEQDFVQGTVLFRQGDIGDTFYLLYEGAVEIHENGVMVNELRARSVNGVQEAQCFGELALIHDQPRAATVVVSSETAKVLQLDRESFDMHLGPLQYFNENLGDCDDDDASEDVEPCGDDARGGDPFEEQFDRARGRGAATPHERRRTDKRVDDKLWALGMSHEQLARSALQKQTEKEARLERWPPWRKRVYWLSHLRAFKFITVSFIGVNAGGLVLLVSFPPEDAGLAELILYTCKVAFLVEATVRLVGNAKGRLSGWLRMDLCLAVLVAIELLLLPWRSRLRNGLHVLAAIQSVRVVRYLRMLKAIMVPLRVILHSLGPGATHLASAGVFVGLIWLAAAICFTALLSEGLPTEEPEGEAQLLIAARTQELFGSVARSMLTALEITVGGLCWGSQVFDPLITSGAVYLQVGACGVLTLVILNSFLILNLVLGIYVRQVVLISREYEMEREQQALYEGESGVKRLRSMLQKVDFNSDGRISKNELEERLLCDEDILKALRLGPDEISILHSALDSDGSGNVTISDFLFGVLKLTGASKTLDMLSIDYRQKMLLRSMTMLEQTYGARLESITQDLDLLCEYAGMLNRRIKALDTSVTTAKGDLQAEIERLGRIADRARRQAEQNQILVEARRKQEILEVRERIQTDLEGMHSQLGQLARARHFRLLSSGDGAHVAAVRRAVRTRLDAEVGPWLDSQLDRVNG